MTRAKEARLPHWGGVDPGWPFLGPRPSRAFCGTTGLGSSRSTHLEEGGGHVQDESRQNTRVEGGICLTGDLAVAFSTGSKKGQERNVFLFWGSESLGKNCFPPHPFRPRIPSTPQSASSPAVDFLFPLPAVAPQTSSPAEPALTFVPRCPAPASATFATQTRSPPSSQRPGPGRAPSGALPLE